MGKTPWNEYIAQTRARNAEIRRLKAAKWTQQRIADKFGITKQRVGQILAAAK